MNRRFLWSLLLALLLPLAQVAAAAHEASHAKAAPHSIQCDQCAAAAAVSGGAAAIATPLVPAGESVAFVPLFIAAAPHLAPRHPDFHSRAPPLSH